jgi:hypothetical protein
MRNSKLLAIMLILIILYIPAYANVVFASSDFVLISTLWGSQSNPQKVYPGSSNVRFIVLIRNNFSNLISIVGYLKLPPGFYGSNGANNVSAVGYISANNTIRYTINKGEIFELDYYLSITSTLTPGTYYGNLTLNYTTSTLTSGSANMTVPMTVSNFPYFTFQIISIYWSTTGGTIINASPGARNIVLNVVLRNMGEDNINSISAQLILSTPFTPNKVISNTQQVNKGSTFTLTFNGISVNFNANPGNYIGNLKLNSTFIGYGGATNISTSFVTLPLTIGSYPSAGLQVIRVQWTNGEKIYAGSRQVSLDITLQNMGSYTVNNIMSQIILPIGFTNSYGLNVINASSMATLGYGNTVTLSFNPIYVNSSIKPGVYSAKLIVMAVVSIDNSYLVTIDTFNVPIYVNNLTLSIDLVSVQWLYNGNPVPALPGGQYLVLSLTFVNRGENTYSGFQPILKIPQGFRVFGESEDTGPIAPGATFTIRFYMNISDTVTPGLYNANLTLIMSVDSSSINTVGLAKFTIPLSLMDPKNFDTRITFVSAYWGTGAPNPVYPGSKNVPLTIEIINTGIYTAQGVQISVTANPYFIPIVNSTSISAALSSGSSASVTLYFDVSPDTVPGFYPFIMITKYFINIYGATIYKYSKLTFTLYVSKPSVGPPYITLVTSGWANNYPIYPGTQNATFNVMIANESPFSVAGIHLKLILPDGFSPGVNGIESYIAGPIQQWQTASASFSIDVGKNVKPGFYTARLKIDYILLSGGDNVKNTEEKEIVLQINSLGGFEYVTYSWIGYAPNPGSVGATLITVIRNTEVPIVKGIVATVILPEGFNSTITGTRIFNTTPYILTSLNQVQNLLQTRLTPGSQFVIPQQTTQAGLGDFLAVPISVSISRNMSPGYYPITLVLSFLDQWNVLRKVTINGTFWLPGSSDIIQVVEGKSKLLVGNRTAEISIYFRNNGSSSVYNVYVAITNIQAPISISSTVKYVPVIGPNEEVPVSWIASVNPSISYLGSIPVMLSITFVDPAGFRHNITQTAILFVEGVAKIKFIDVTVEPKVPYPGSTITVSMTLINLGTYKAGNLEAFLEGDNLTITSNSYSFVGDVDVGSQMPVSLSANINNINANKTTIYVVIRFRNVFNEIITERYPITLILASQPPSTQTQTSSTVLSDTYRLLIVMAIIIFLAISSYVIYLLYRRTKR